MCDSINTVDYKRLYVNVAVFSELRREELLRRLGIYSWRNTYQENEQEKDMTGQ
jgi:hypothetical protein